MNQSIVRMPRSIFYGRNSFLKVGEETVKLGKKALLISDQVMKELGLVDQCKGLLDEQGVDCTTYLEISSEPTDIFVQEALQTLQQENCDVVIALGGGSCIDTAKAVVILATNGGTIDEYMNNQKLAAIRPVPLIAIPTTAGTGSEATDVTVISNTKTKVKMMIKQPAFMPEIAVVDPVLTVSSPKSITAATGVDALTHAIEAYISRRAHPFTDTLALSAIELIFNNIRTAYFNGEDIDAREKMALGAMQAGMAFSNASVCLVHGMSRPIGALFHVPHGVSNAMLLPAVLEFSQKDCVERLAEIGQLLFQGLEGLTTNQVAQRLVEEVKSLCLDLQIPNMKDWGIDGDSLNKVVEKMAEDALNSGSPGNNPRVPTKDEIIELYHICYDYQYKAEIKEGNKLG
jgi:alcohol dehydrogenase class IV